MAQLNAAVEEATTSTSPRIEQNGEKTNKEDDNAAEKKVPFHKLFSFADPTDVALMVIGSIGAVGNGLAMPLMAILLGDLIDSFGQNQNTKHVIHVGSQVSLKYVYLAIGAGIAAFLQVACWMVTRERQAARIRNLYLKTIIRQDIAFFDKEVSTGEVVGRMSGDTVLMQDAMGEKVGQFIQLISTFVGGFVISFIKGWLLTVVMLSSIPIIVSAGALMTIFISKATMKGQSSYNKAAIVAEETISSIRTVASFTGEKQAITKYNKAIDDAYRSGVLEEMAEGSGLGIVMFVIFCSYALAIWFGSRMVLQGHYTGGTVIIVMVAESTGSLSLGQASPSLSAFSTGQAAAYKLFQTIYRKPDIDPYDPSGKVLDEIHGHIELKDVNFSYPARPDEQIFSEFSLSIDSGTTAALVGQSGSGKSTVISLIERFYDPQSGEVLIDGINMKEFQLRYIRQNITLVSQEPVLFGSTIKDNISYGKDGATDEEIKAAIELANAAKFINKLPQGLDTLVGDHGIQLSGGQKQRVAIARAILKNPRILLLDEATSALDGESERIVQEALGRIMVDRTTVVVAHHLSTVRNADIIAVIHQGKVVEKGPHSELVKDIEGAYSQFIRLQQLGKVSQQAEESGDFLRQSSQRRLSLRSSSRGSSRRASSNHYSFSIVAGVPTDYPEIIVPEAESVSVPPSEELPPVSCTRLASLNRPDIPILIFGSLSAIVNGVIFPMFGIIFSGAIKMFFKPPHELRKDARFWALMFVVLGFASLLSSPARSYFFAAAGCKLIRRVRSMCFGRVINMEVGWFDEPENSSGAIGARLSADAANVCGLVGGTLGLLVQNIATAIAGLLIAFLANWVLAFIILAMIHLLGLNGYFQLKFIKGFSDDAKRKYEEASQVANDAVGSIRTVVSFCAEEKVMQLYEKKCEAPMQAGIKRGLISGIGFGFSYALLFCVYALSFYAGAQLVGHGKTTFSDVFRVFFALSMTAIGISQTSPLAPDSSKAKSAVASVFAILDRKSKIDPSDESGMILEKMEGEIEFRHVKFTYPTRPDVHILEDVCLIIQPGQGYDTIVGERGVQLSGGQKQRVAIARAIVKNPKILLLDEATSALDAESEKVVQDAVDQVMVNRTTVIVAHRLSTIKNADVIAVVKNGVIAEKGRHEKLIRIKDECLLL